MNDIDSNMNRTQMVINSLITNLQHEIDIYSQLEKTLIRKQQAIIKSDIDDLRESVHLEQSLIYKAQIIADARVDQVTAWCKLSRIPSKTPTLATIIQSAPSLLKPRLTKLREQLRSLLDRVSYANRENKILLNSSIEYLQGLISIFLQTDEKAPQIYGKEGVIALQNLKTKVLDYQI